jgi:hypothetical protein
MYLMISLNYGHKATFMISILGDLEFILLLESIKVHLFKDLHVNLESRSFDFLVQSRLHVHIYLGQDFGGSGLLNAKSLHSPRSDTHIGRS